MREMVAKRLAPLGVVLNTEMNSKIAGFKDIHEGIITEPASRINIMVLPTNEEIMIDVLLIIYFTWNSLCYS